MNLSPSKGSKTINVNVDCFNCFIAHLKLYKSQFSIGKKNGSWLRVTFYWYLKPEWERRSDPWWCHSRHQRAISSCLGKLSTLSFPARLTSSHPCAGAEPTEFTWKTSPGAVLCKSNSIWLLSHSPLGPPALQDVGLWLAASRVQ